MQTATSVAFMDQRIAALNRSTISSRGWEDRSGVGQGPSGTAAGASGSPLNRHLTRPTSDHRA